MEQEDQDSGANDREYRQVHVLVHCFYGIQVQGISWDRDNVALAVLSRLKLPQ